MKIVLRILTVLTVAYLFVMPFHLSHKAGERLCSKVDVVISDSGNYMFVNKSQILDMVNNREDSVLGRPVHTISADGIEKEISSIREISSVEVWFDIEGTMNIAIEQRKPIIRVIPDGGGDYLVDEEGIVFRRSQGNSPRLHIVGGNIKITNQMLEGISLTDPAMADNALLDAYRLAIYIRKDNFWSSQIDQIYINKKDELELVPRIGSHTIKMGLFDDFGGKMENLGLFYEQVMTEIGWDKYSEISLEYNGQIVCKRRL